MEATTYFDLLREDRVYPLNHLLLDLKLQPAGAHWCITAGAGNALVSPSVEITKANFRLLLIRLANAAKDSDGGPVKLTFLGQEFFSVLVPIVKGVKAYAIVVGLTSQVQLNRADDPSTKE